MAENARCPKCGEGKPTWDRVAGTGTGECYRTVHECYRAARTADSDPSRASTGPSEWRLALAPGFFEDGATNWRRCPVKQPRQRGSRSHPWSTRSAAASAHAGMRDAPARHHP